MAVSSRELDCEPSVRAIHNLSQEIATVEDQIQALEVDAMYQLDPLHYFRLQYRIDRLIGIKSVLQDKWNNEMNELALCRSSALRL